MRMNGNFVDCRGLSNMLVPWSCFQVPASLSSPPTCCPDSSTTICNDIDKNNAPDVQLWTYLDREHAKRVTLTARLRPRPSTKHEPASLWQRRAELSLSRAHPLCTADGRRPRGDWPAKTRACLNQRARDGMRKEMGRKGRMN